MTRLTHARLSKFAEKIAEVPQDDWRTDVLAAEAGLSPRSLSRLFRKELNASPSKFVERVRIVLIGRLEIQAILVRRSPGRTRRSADSWQVRRLTQTARTWKWPERGT
jgi:hypothetical protein